jgi:hypothetical protein
MHRTGKNESDSDRLTINTNIKANPYQIEMQQVNLPPNLK